MRAGRCFSRTLADKVLSMHHQRRTVMKSRLLLIPAIVATAAALGVSGNALAESLDAQSHAAALLSRPHAPESLKAYEQGDAPSSSERVDTHASAAALLTGRSAGSQARASVRIAPQTVVRIALDAHAQAAALLSGSRTPISERSRTTAIGERSAEHPAVLVAQKWSTRGIDSNEFIVAHPAGLRLVDASPTE